MVDVPSFGDAIRVLSDELRLEPHSPDRLNQVASRIDQLGRRLHGHGWVRDHEIGGCLTAAVSGLTEARDQPEGDRGASVRQVLLQLEAALVHTEEGLRPAEAAPVTEPSAPEVARGA